MLSLKKLLKRNKNDKTNKKWLTAIKNSKIGVWDYNAKTNKVFYSKESLNILGYKEGEIKNIAEEWSKRVHPDDRDSYFSELNAHISREENTYTNEYRVLCKDNTYKWILDHGKIISKDKNGKPKRIIGTHIDITQRKRNEELLKENVEIVSSQNKRLYNFTHIVSHNLKTHIGNLKNILEFYEAAENKDEKDQMFDYLKSISSSLTTTITDLNEIISVRSESKDLIDNIYLNQSISKILYNLELDIKKKDAVISNQVNHKLCIIGNESYIESIFYNLISNALKYNSPDKATKVIIKSLNTDTGYNIIITDNGIGINLDKYEKQLFEMYQTFHESKREDSKGIGLYLTKIQVEDLGGKITVDSELGVGTTFTISFPKEKAFVLE